MLEIFSQSSYSTRNPGLDNPVSTLDTLMSNLDNPVSRLDNPVSRLDNPVSKVAGAAIVNTSDVRSLRVP